jgi:hypothetical protein
MSNRKLYFALGYLLLLPIAVIAAQPSSDPFVVIELFTSEGCSSCPPADRILNEIALEARQKKMHVYPLSMHVDYWDYLGWRDPFSDQKFSLRQERYAQAFGHKGVYTPEVVVNGQYGFGGYDRNRLNQHIGEFLKTPAPASIGLELTVLNSRAKLRYKAHVNGPSVINVALVERDVKIKVERGENAGSVLAHENVVRDFRVLDAAGQGELEMDLPRDFQPARFSVIAYVQEKESLKVSAAGAADFKE